MFSFTGGCLPSQGNQEKFKVVETLLAKIREQICALIENQGRHATIISCDGFSLLQNIKFEYILNIFIEFIRYKTDLDTL